MKKILILAIFVLTLTGCSATYEVEIYNDKVKEKLQYIETNSSLWGENVDGNTTYRETVINSSKHPYPAFYNSPTNEDDSVKAKGVQYYKNKLISDNYKLGQELSYNKFKLNNYPNSYIISKC